MELKDLAAGCLHRSSLIAVLADHVKLGEQVRQVTTSDPVRPDPRCRQLWASSSSTRMTCQSQRRSKVRRRGRSVSRSRSGWIDGWLCGSVAILASATARLGAAVSITRMPRAWTKGYKTARRRGFHGTGVIQSPSAERRDPSSVTVLSTRLKCPPRAASTRSATRCRPR